jgi:hypothetical protein
VVRKHAGFAFAMYLRITVFKLDSNRAVLFVEHMAVIKDGKD